MEQTEIEKLISALKRIKSRLSGIEAEDLTKAEKNILSICEETLKT